jgi:hypothetical protein
MKTEKEKKYVIELSEDQMRLVASCLEDVSRFASGQYELRHTIEQMLRGGYLLKNRWKDVIRLKIF